MDADGEQGVKLTRPEAKQVISLRDSRNQRIPLHLSEGKLAISGFLPRQLCRDLQKLIVWRDTDGPAPLKP